MKTMKINLLVEDTRKRKRTTKVQKLTIPGARKIPKTVQSVIKNKAATNPAEKKIKAPEQVDNTVPIDESFGDIIHDFLNIEGSEHCLDDLRKWSAMVGVSVGLGAFIGSLAVAPAASDAWNSTRVKNNFDKISSKIPGGETRIKVGAFREKIKSATTDHKKILDSLKKNQVDPKKTGVIQWLKRFAKLRNVPLGMLLMSLAAWGTSKTLQVAGVEEGNIVITVLDTISYIKILDSLVIGGFAGALAEVDREDTWACITLYVIFFGALLATITRYGRKGFQTYDNIKWRNEFLKNAEILNKSFLSQLDAGFLQAQKTAEQNSIKYFQRTFKKPNNVHTNTIIPKLPQVRKEIYEAMSTGRFDDVEKILRKFGEQLKGKGSKGSKSKSTKKSSNQSTEAIPEDLIRETMKGLEKYADDLGKEMTKSYGQILKLNATGLASRADELKFGTDDLTAISKKIYKEYESMLKNWEKGVSDSPEALTKSISEFMSSLNHLAISGNPLMARKFMNQLALKLNKIKTPKAKVGKDSAGKPLKVKYPLKINDIIKEAETMFNTSEFERVLDDLIVVHLKDIGKKRGAPYKGGLAPTKLDQWDKMGTDAPYGKTGVRGYYNAEHYARTYIDKAIKEANERIAQRSSDPGALIDPAVAFRAKSRVSSIVKKRILQKAPRWRDELKSEALMGVSALVAAAAIVAAYGGMYGVKDELIPESPWGFDGPVPDAVQDIMNSASGYTEYSKFLRVLDQNPQDRGKLGLKLFEYDETMKKFIDESARDNWSPNSTVPGMARTKMREFLAVKKEPFKQYINENMPVIAGANSPVMEDDFDERLEKIVYMLANIYIYKSTLRQRLLNYYYNVHKQTDSIEERKAALKKVWSFKRAQFAEIGDITLNQMDLSKKFQKALEEGEEEEEEKQSGAENLIDETNVLIIGDSTSVAIVDNMRLDIPKGKKIKRKVAGIDFKLPGYINNNAIALGAASTSIIAGIVKSEVSKDDFPVPRVAVIHLGYNDLHKNFKVKNTIVHFKTIINTLINKGVKDIRIVGTRTVEGTRKGRNKRTDRFFKDPAQARVLHESLRSLCDNYPETTFIPNTEESGFKHTDGVHYRASSSRNILNTALRGGSTNLDDLNEEVRALAACLQIETIGGMSRHAPEAVAAVAFVRQKSKAFGNNLKDVVSGPPQRGKLGSGWLNVSDYKSQFKDIYNKGPESQYFPKTWQKCVNLAEKYVQNKEELISKYNGYDSYIHVGGMPRRTTDRGYNRSMILFDFSRANIKGNPGNLGKRYIQPDIEKAIQRGRAFFVGRNLMMHDQFAPIAKAVSRDTGGRLNIPLKPKKIKKRKGLEEVITMNKKTLRELVSEVLNENSGTGYAKYPYHSNEISEQEPDEDYSVEWSSLVEEVCGHRKKNVDGDPNTSEDMAVEVAKIFVKDSELFREVLEIVGSNKSLGVEIMKQLKSALSKENK